MRRPVAMRGLRPLSVRCGPAGAYAGHRIFRQSILAERSKSRSISSPITHLNGRPENHLQFDYRTGQPTAITGPFISPVGREACAALNRSRAKGILAAIKVPSSGESLEIDVWTALVASAAREWDVPLIPLAALEIFRDGDGFLLSPSMAQLPPGQEALPFADQKAGVVYKLFYLKPSGGLGRKVALARNSDGEFEMAFHDALVMETVEKICVLHEAGAHPTEIVGITDSGEFLIVKQPLARLQPYSMGISSAPTEDLFIQDRQRAIDAMKGVPCVSPGLRRTVAVTVVNGDAWVVADLHERNIMRDVENEPTVIDALVGLVTAGALSGLPRLGDAVERARVWRETGTLPEEVDFAAGDDSEL
jgi:hypothetical protein